MSQWKKKYHCKRYIYWINYHCKRYIDRMKERNGADYINIFWISVPSRKFFAEILITSQILFVYHCILFNWLCWLPNFERNSAILFTIADIQGFTLWYRWIKNCQERQQGNRNGGYPFLSYKETADGEGYRNQSKQ